MFGGVPYVAGRRESVKLDYERGGLYNTFGRRRC
jgi:hypothetical protein